MVSGTGSPDAKPRTDNVDVAKQVQGLRAQVHKSFGAVAIAMMALPRYRHQSIADLGPLVLDPLVRDRVAMAYTSKSDAEDSGDVAGLAIWASVSDEVDKKIREQIAGGSFPIRLKPEDWNSGEINWLLDVIASDEKTTGAVLANFKQVVKNGKLRLHPIIGRLLDKATLEKMQGTQVQTDASPSETDPS